MAVLLLGRPCRAWGGACVSRRYRHVRGCIVVAEDEEERWPWSLLSCDLSCIAPSYLPLKPPHDVKSSTSRLLVGLLEVCSFKYTAVRDTVHTVAAHTLPHNSLVASLPRLSRASRRMLAWQLTGSTQPRLRSPFAAVRQSNALPSQNVSLPHSGSGRSMLSAGRAIASSGC